MNVRHSGVPGHYCGVWDCRFRLTTIVDGYMISTVGARYIEGELVEIGYRRHYETFVFRVDDMGEPMGYNEIDASKVYCGEVSRSNKLFDAIAEMHHEEMVKKWRS